MESYVNRNRTAKIPKICSIFFKTIFYLDLLSVELKTINQLYEQEIDMKGVRLLVKVVRKKIQ